ncbi:MAG: hypothetical protein LUH40_04505 [Clostridiales bacterium]|nr:hypothetical protein [Clostridiales bacterium]
MYAIIRNGDGRFYTSVVFGYFCEVTATDNYKRYLESIFNRFYLVLDEKKERLIKRFVFLKENKYLDPQILILDADQTEWTFTPDGQGYMSFLNGVNFSEESFSLSSEQIAQCSQIDSQYIYHEFQEVSSLNDIKNFSCVSGNLHDAYIKKCERNNDEIYVLFGGVWGCQIEIWFFGDVDYCIESRNPETDDPAWLGATLIYEDGYFYLVDDEDMKVADITDEYCWFKGRHLKYRVIPNK